MQPHVHSSIIYNSQDREATQVPISRWADKKAVAHVPNGILLGHKKEWNLTFCNSMDGLEGIMLSEVGQTERDKCHVISLICGI